MSMAEDELAIEEIIPYDGNPRRIPEEAIAAVQDSISRYGYQQRIVVDAQNVIVVGHTRLAALQRLGWTRVPVYRTGLPPDKVREYRLVDNRTGELTSWDYDALILELRDLDAGVIDTYFPDVDLEVGLVHSAVTSTDVADADTAVREVTPQSATGTHTTTVVCPSCFHSFEVRTRSLPGLSSADLEALAYGTDAAG